MKEKRKLGLTVVSILLTVGLGISLYQTQHFHALRSAAGSFKSFCNFSSIFSCDAVESSRYAEFLFGLPLSAYVCGWYVAMIVMSLLARAQNWRMTTTRALFGMAGFSVLATVVYLYIMMTQLKAYCFFCMIIDVINSVTFVILLREKNALSKEPVADRSQWKTLAAIALGGVAITFPISAALAPLRTSSQELNDIIESVLNTPQQTVPVDPRDPTLGPADAPITIVKFSDFQCPSCRRGAIATRPLFYRFPTKIRLVYKNYPLDQACNPKMTHPMHEYACEAAKAALCANEQGLFAKVYEELFEHQDEFATTSPTQRAVLAGVDETKLKACMSDPRTLTQIQRTIEEGSALSVQSTPTFFINGRKVEGAYPTEVWIRILEKM